MELFETIWSTERASLTLERRLFSDTGAIMYFFKLAMTNGWETKVSLTVWSGEEGSDEESVKENAIETAKWKVRQMRKLEIYSECWNKVHRRLWNGDIFPDRETGQKLSDALKLIEEETERNYDQ